MKLWLLKVSRKLHRFIKKCFKAMSKLFSWRIKGNHVRIIHMAISCSTDFCVVVIVLCLPTCFMSALNASNVLSLSCVRFCLCFSRRRFRHACFVFSREKAKRCCTVFQVTDRKLYWQKREENPREKSMYGKILFPPRCRHFTFFFHLERMNRIL